MNLAGIPDFNWKLNILPYVDGKDVFSLSRTNKKIKGIVEDSLLNTLAILYQKPVESFLGKRLRDSLFLAGNEICKASPFKKLSIQRSLLQEDRLPSPLFLLAKYRQDQRMNLTKKISERKNVTRQRAGLTVNSKKWFDEGFVFEAIDSLNSIKNRNRFESFKQVFDFLLEENKLEQAVKLAFGIKAPHQNRVLFFLGLKLKEKYGLQHLQEVLLAIESLIPAMPISYPFIMESKKENPFSSIKTVLVAWGLLRTLRSEDREKFLEILNSLKKTNQAHFIFSMGFILLDQGALKGLENPLYISLVIELYQKGVNVQDLFIQNLYEQYFSFQKNQDVILRMRFIVQSIQFSSSISFVEVLDLVIEKFKAAGKEEDQKYIEDLLKFKNL